MTKLVEALIIVTQARGSRFEANKNGLMPLVCTCKRGRMPIRKGGSIFVLDGTIATGLGVEPNNEYYATFNMTGTSEEYGDNWNVLKAENIASMKITERIELSKYLGEPVTFEMGNAQNDSIKEKDNTNAAPVNEKQEAFS